MKRKTMHALFGVVAGVLAGAVAFAAIELRRAEALNQAVARVAARPVEVNARSQSDDAPPELRFAHARALAVAGQTDAAVKQYNALIQQSSPAGIRRAALYNLANLYLRQSAATDAGQALATTELAKQRYRDLLHADPLDWDARYNLERALRMAPDDEAAFDAVSAPPVERRQVQMRGMEPGDLP